MSGINRRTFLTRTGVASIGVAGLAGCLGDGGSGGGGESPEDADEIVIGCPTALSGAFAPYGEAERDGGILAAQHLEEEFDVSIEIVEGDSEADPNAAVDRIEDMVINDGAHMAFGGVSSSVAIATGSWGTENQVPVSVHGGSDDITGAECASYMFSPYMSNSMQVAPTAPAMADLEDEWFLLYSDYTWGHTARDAYEEALEAEGAEVVGTEGVPFPETEYGPYLNTAEQSGASGIALLVAGLDQRAVTGEILNREIGDDYTFMLHQNEDVGFAELSTEAPSIIDVSSQGWSPSLDVPDDWLAEIAEVSDHSPFVRHYMGYVSVDQLVRASMRADSLEGEAIRDELRGHVIENDLIYDLQPTEQEMYWREADNQLVQPTYVTSGLDPDDQQTDPYMVAFQVDEMMEGEDASPEPDPACEL